MAFRRWGGRNRRLTAARSRSWSSRAPSWCWSDWRGRHSYRCRHSWCWSRHRLLLANHSCWRDLYDGSRRRRSRYLNHSRQNRGGSNWLGDNNRNRRLYSYSRSRGDNFSGCCWRGICALSTASTATAAIATRRTRWRCCRRWTNGRRNRAWGWGDGWRSYCWRGYRCFRSRNDRWCCCFYSGRITSSTTASTAAPLFRGPRFRSCFASRQLQLSPRTCSTSRACRRCGLCLAGALTAGASWIATQPKHPWTCAHQLGGGPSHLGLQTGLHHRVGLATHHR